MMHENQQYQHQQQVQQNQSTKYLQLLQQQQQYQSYRQKIMQQEKNCSNKQENLNISRSLYVGNLHIYI